MKARVFVIGDVHGCFDELMLLLKKAKCDPQKERVILVGDLINKGPDSFKVLSWAYEQKIEIVIGNHELKFLGFCEKQPEALGPELEKLKEAMGPDLKKWLSWIKNWPVYIEEEGFLIIHGGLVPGEHPEQSKIEYLVNIRYWDGCGKDMNNPMYPPWHDFYAGSKLVVYGHWAKQGLKIKENSIGLDTACVYGGQLSGLWLPEKKIVQVSSLQSRLTNF